jgi:hypothetical protein
MKENASPSSHTIAGRRETATPTGSASVCAGVRGGWRARVVRIGVAPPGERTPMLKRTGLSESGP